MRGQWTDRGRYTVTNQSCSPRDRGLGLERARLGLVTAGLDYNTVTNWTPVVGRGHSSHYSRVN